MKMADYCVKRMTREYKMARDSRMTREYKMVRDSRMTREQKQEQSLEEELLSLTYCLLFVLFSLQIFIKRVHLIIIPIQALKICD